MTHLEATLKELKCLLTTDSGIAADLLVTANAERSDGKSGLGEHGGLASQAFQHLFQNMNAKYTWLQNTLSVSNMVQAIVSNYAHQVKLYRQRREVRRESSILNSEE